MVPIAEISPLLAVDFSRGTFVNFGQAALENDFIVSGGASRSLSPFRHFLVRLTF